MNYGAELIKLAKMISESKLKVNIKRLSDKAVIPSYAQIGDAGMDITATSVEETPDKVIYGTGLAFEIPEGHVGLLFPRSSIHKMDLSLSNHVGVLDAGYRGEVKFIFRKNHKYQSYEAVKYEVGDRIGQIIVIPFPQVEFAEVSELSDTERGEGGFGSTGK